MTTIDRETFLEELKLRKYIKETIRLNEKKRTQGLLQTLKEEQKLRNVIKQILLREKEEDRPHASTGINVLSDLLKKIMPVLEIDYKKMTSHPMQRQSFSAHILKAVTNTLATENSADEADEETTGQKQAGLPDQPGDDSDLAEAEVNLDVQPEQQPNPDDEKFIDIERPSEKKAKANKNKPDPKEDFGIEGEDTTGRNIAMSCFDKIETSIQDSYQILSDSEDKRVFYDYLVVNLKLYFKKYDDEMKAIVQEPQVSPDAQRDLPGQGI